MTSLVLRKPKLFNPYWVLPSMFGAIHKFFFEIGELWNGISMFIILQLYDTCLLFGYIFGYMFDLVIY